MTDFTCDFVAFSYIFKLLCVCLLSFVVSHFLIKIPAKCSWPLLVKNYFIILQPDFAFVEERKGDFRKNVDSFRVFTKGQDIIKVLDTLITE